MHSPSQSDCFASAPVYPVESRTDTAQSGGMRLPAHKTSLIGQGLQLNEWQLEWDATGWIFGGLPSQQLHGQDNAHP